HHRVSARLPELGREAQQQFGHDHLTWMHSVEERLVGSCEVLATPCCSSRNAALLQAPRKLLIELVEPLLHPRYRRDLLGDNGSVGREQHSGSNTKLHESIHRV